jgi:hypothetical protein
VQIPTFVIPHAVHACDLPETVLDIAHRIVDAHGMAEMVSLTVYCEASGEYAARVWDRDNGPTNLFF